MIARTSRIRDSTSPAPVCSGYGAGVLEGVPIDGTEVRFLPEPWNASELLRTLRSRIDGPDAPDGIGPPAPVVSGGPRT